MSTDTIFGLDQGLFISETGLAITAVSALIGIWIDRDEDRPLRYSIWLTVLVILATGVGCFQTYQDYLGEVKLKGDIARVLQKLDTIVHHGVADVPELNEIVKSEIAEKSRENPDIIAAIAQRAADEGADPKAVFATYLPEGDVERIAGDGNLKVKASDLAIARIDGQTTAPVRPALTFGHNKPRLRSDSGAPHKVETEKKP